MSRITRKLSAIRVHFSWSRISFPCLPVTRRKFAKSIVSSASGAMYHHIPVLDNLLLVSLDGKHLSSCVLYRLAAQEAAQRDPGYASQYRRRPRLAGLSGLGDWTSFGGEVRVNLEKPSEKNIRWSHRSRGPFSVPVLRSRRGESCVLFSFAARKDWVIARHCPRKSICFPCCLVATRKILIFREKRSFSLAVRSCMYNLRDCLWRTWKNQIETETGLQEDITKQLWRRWVCRVHRTSRRDAKKNKKESKGRLNWRKL